jgi:hypothetical protein
MLAGARTGPQSLRSKVTGRALYTWSRRRTVAPTRADLERIDAGEPGEVAALQHDVAKLQREVVTVMRDRESRRSGPPLIAELRRTADRVRTRMRG